MLLMPLPFLNDPRFVLPVLIVTLGVATIAYVRELRRQSRQRAAQRKH
jgi:hypothetical protein